MTSSLYQDLTSAILFAMEQGVILRKDYPTEAEQRQAFLDEAAMRMMPTLVNTPLKTRPDPEQVNQIVAEATYGFAEALWNERQRRIEAEGSEA